MVFDKTWFQQHQRKLIWLLNASIIKHWFRFVMCIESKETINQITPNSYSFGAKFIDKDTVKVNTDFRTYNKYAKQLYYNFRPLWYLLHFIDWLLLDRMVPELSFQFLTLTQYPGSIGANNPVEGRIIKDDSTVWATTHDATDGTGTVTTSLTARSSRSGGGGTLYRIYRCFENFDTSALTASAVISAATFSAWGVQVDNNDSDAQAYINVYANTMASTSAIADADFDQVGSTAFAANRDLSGITADDTVYTVFTFNATGIAAISKTGISKFSVREGHDAENLAIADSAINSFVWKVVGTAGTANDPKLIVTYTIAVATVATNNLSLLGVGT